MMMVGVTRKRGEMGNFGQDIMIREEKNNAVYFKILMIH